MTLVLMRHGRATGVDDASPLTDEGFDEARSTARQLRSRGIASPRIVHSGLRRAEETAGVLADVLGASPPRGDERFQPEASIDEAIAAIDPSAAPLVIVSHQPMLPRLAGRLLEDDAAGGALRFSTATAAILDLNGGSWTLRGVVRAGDDD